MSNFQPQTKGSIAVGSTVGAAGSITPLAVGADGTVLTADSSTPTGLKYAVASGPQGLQGFQGPEGAQGPQGFQGSQGFQGISGPQGVQGVQGNQGSSQDGAQGPQGPTGPSSITEITGPVGVTDTFASVISITPAAGTYMVWFMASANNISAASMQVRISVGGSPVTNSLKTFDNDGQLTDLFMATMARVTVNGAEAIDVEADADAGASSYDLNNLQLMICLTS